MSLTQFFSSYFDSEIRKRGSLYFAQGTVKKTIQDVNACHATVRSSYAYSVSLSWNISFYPAKFHAECSCPYYKEGSFCKHLWAAFLAFEQAGLSIPLPTKRESVSLLHMDDKENEKIFNKEKVFSPPLPAVIPLKKVTHSPSQLIKQLQELRSSLEQPTSYSYTEKTSLQKTAEIWYFLSISQSIQNQKLTILFYHRSHLESGKLGKMKPLVLSSKEIDLINSPEDRNFLQILFGGDPSDQYSHYYGYSPLRHGKSILPPLLQNWFLPQLASSGRLVVCQKNEPKDSDCLSPLEWKGEIPFRFDAKMELDPTGTQWILRGKLSNGVEKIDLKHIQMFLPDVFLFKNTLCPLQTTRTKFILMNQWMENRPLTIPRGEEQLFIEELYKFSDFPLEIIPQELRFEERSPSFKVRLQFEKRQKNAREKDPDFQATLFFDYEGKEFRFDKKNEKIFIDSEKREVLFRNLTEELKIIHLLKTIGFRREESFYEGPSFVLPSKLFSKAILQCLDLEWKVDLEKQKIVHPQEWNFSITSEMDWFDLSMSIDFAGIKVGFPEVLEALQRGERFLTLSDRSQALLSEEWLNSYAGLMQLGKSSKGKIRYTSSQAMLVHAILEKEQRFVMDDSFQKLLEKLRNFEGIREMEPSRNFQGTLRKYQKEGLGWLHFLKEFGFGGCLADDMGLGKTIQLLAFLEQQHSTDSKKKKTPSLVVVPRSLVYNWMEEAKRFTPNLKILDYTGIQRQTALSSFQEQDLIVTTYGTLRKDLEKIAPLEFQFLILDEAQAIKNASSQIAKVVKQIFAHHRLAMTGTPVENHLGELWSLFEFLNPGLLGTVSRFQQFSKIQNGTEQTVQLLAKGLKPFILRRTKSEVLKELPSKTEQTLFCELLDDQKKLYSELKLFYQVKLTQKIAKDGIAKNKIHILEALLRLRQAACHPGLIDSKRKSESSAKLETLLEQLKEILEEGHKVLVFSQFTQMLGIVRKKLDAEKVVYEYLDGKTRDRKSKVDRFQNDPSCPLFLISLKAGGFGLNLTAADYVFLLDPWWNPAVEAQAIDRTHRIGQNKPVFAYRLIAKGTIEEKILELQASKKELAEGILSGSTSLIRQLTREDLEFLLG